MIHGFPVPLRLALTVALMTVTAMYAALQSHVRVSTSPWLFLADLYSGSRFEVYGVMTLWLVTCVLRTRQLDSDLALIRDGSRIRAARRFFTDAAVALGAGAAVSIAVALAAGALVPTQSESPPPVLTAPASVTFLLVAASTAATLLAAAAVTCTVHLLRLHRAAAPACAFVIWLFLAVSTLADLGPVDADRLFSASASLGNVIGAAAVALVGGLVIARPRVFARPWIAFAVILVVVCASSASPVLTRPFVGAWGDAADHLRFVVLVDGAAATLAIVLSRATGPRRQLVVVRYGSARRCVWASWGRFALIGAALAALAPASIIVTRWAVGRPTESPDAASWVTVLVVGALQYLVVLTLIGWVQTTWASLTVTLTVLLGLTVAGQFPFAANVVALGAGTAADPRWPTVIVNAVVSLAFALLIAPVWIRFLRRNSVRS